MPILSSPANFSLRFLSPLFTLILSNAHSFPPLDGEVEDEKDEDIEIDISQFTDPELTPLDMKRLSPLYLSLSPPSSLSRVLSSFSTDQSTKWMGKKNRGVSVAIRPRVVL